MSTVDTDNNIFSNLGLTRELETKKRDELGQAQFLELMVTQLTNQDPFEPMENGDFIAQMAQFSSVTGLNKLNESFAELSASLISNQSLQASALVGHEVMAPLEYGVLPMGGSLSGEVDVPPGTNNLRVTVSDTSGALVKEINLGMQPAGPLEFKWDGATDYGDYASPGVYRIEAQASSNGQNSALQTLITARVNSVSFSPNGQGLKLNLDGLGPISLNDVRQIH